MPKTFWFWLGIIFTLISATLVGVLGTPSAKVFINSHPVPVEVVDTFEERGRGLSGRSSLPRPHGMLFVFEEYGLHPFWMKEMLFPLDIAWLNDSEVVHIEHSVSPDTFPRSFSSSAPAKYVLEVNAGQLKAWGVEVGDRVELVGI
ncbi:MAG: DUF192 domain-containing protein [Candidatus Saccharimonadales bacterium]